MKETYPLISIIIPVKPECNLPKAIHTLQKVDYPLQKLELIIAKGYNPSYQRNEAAKVARGEILYFLDDDSEVCPELFKIAIKHYKNPKIGGIGGPSLAHPKEDKKQQIFSSVLASPFGGFGITSRYKSEGEIRKAKEEDLILCNFSIRKQIFEKFGGFNVLLYPNEENEFYNRLLDANVLLLYDSSLRVYRYARKSFKEFFTQIFRYGRSRMEHIVLRPKFCKLKYFVPLIFVLYFFLAVCCLVFGGSTFILLLLGLYLILNLYFSSKIFKKKKNNLYFLIGPFAAFFTLHIAYGLGSLWGLIKGYLKRKKQKKFETWGKIQIKKINLGDVNVEYSNI